MRLSYSKLSSFETCPFQYYLTNVERAFCPSNKYMMAGQEIHNILYTSTQKEDWKGFLLKYPKYEEYKTMIDNYIEYQEEFIQKGGSPKPMLAETKLYDPEYDFSMIIDRGDLHDGKLLITDYKSDAKPEEGKHDKQLLTYAYFIEKHYKLPVSHINVFFLKSKKHRKHKKINREHIEMAMDWVNSVKNDIESRGNDINKFPPKPSKLCAWCGHYGTGRCKEGKEFIDGSGNLSELLDGELDGK